jgi:hypothetical protein
MLAESSFMFSDYGYWIDPTGSIISCSEMTHGEAAAHQLGVNLPEDDDEAERAIVDEAIQDGGIRIVSPKGSDEFSAEWGMFLSTEARRSLIEVMGFYQGRSVFVLKDEYFTEFSKALRYARTN